MTARAPGARQPDPRHRRRVLRVLGSFAALTVSIVALVLMARSLGTIDDTLRHLRWRWLAVAVVAQVVSMGAFARLQRRLLTEGGVDLPIGSVLAVTYAANAVSATVPYAGSTAATAFTYREYVKRGADVALASWTLALSGLLSGSALAVLVGIGGLQSGNPAVAVAGVIATVLGAVPVLVALAALRSDAVRHRLIRPGSFAVQRIQRVFRRPTGDAGVLTADFLRRLAAFRLSGWHGARAMWFAALNWIADALCLAAVIAALGADVPWQYLLLIFAATLAVASAGLTPAGIGVVEGAMAVALVAAGLPSTVAVPAALLYRAISCWLVIAIGWCVFAVLRRRPPAPGRAELT